MVNLDLIIYAIIINLVIVLLILVCSIVFGLRAIIKNVIRSKELEIGNYFINKNTKKRIMIINVDKCYDMVTFIDDNYDITTYFSIDRLYKEYLYDMGLSKNNKV